MKLKKKNMNGALRNASENGKIHEIIGIARSSNTVGILVRKDYPPLRIAQSAILRSKIQEAPQFFSVWDQNGLVMNKSRHHAQGQFKR
jgi:hypothetical protein